ncbi:TIGR02757 family protein [Crocinitomicaceae bacterium]|nr:TIGR02757 family protein [Crocinitomicaceae bacterium]
MTTSELKEYLDFKTEQYNTPLFIESDPIQLPHRFSKKEDIEIVAFLVSTIAWGKREMIIKNGERLIEIMGGTPHDFILNCTANEPINFVHRTFNAFDLDFFFSSLQNIYLNHGGMENAFQPHAEYPGAKGRIISFRNLFLTTEHEQRSEKHISNPAKNSAAKRINMFLRWMVRNDNCGVDFGIWNSIPESELCIPLDVHTARMSTELGILKRKQNDWKALEEIMSVLRKLDPKDPSKYDFALFGIGVFEKR